MRQINVRKFIAGSPVFASPSFGSSTSEPFPWHALRRSVQSCRGPDYLVTTRILSFLFTEGFRPGEHRSGSLGVGSGEWNRERRTQSLGAKKAGSHHRRCGEEFPLFAEKAVMPCDWARRCDHVRPLYRRWYRPHTNGLGGFVQMETIHACGSSIALLAVSSFVDF